MDILWQLTELILWLSMCFIADSKRAINRYNYGSPSSMPKLTVFQARRENGFAIKYC